MISFFPTPYPDEILYSILARYHIRSGNLSPKATLHDLFGSTTVIATVDLPSHIDALTQNLPPMSKYTAEGIIHQYTLYPFYAPFLSPHTAGLVFDSMKDHSWGDIHTRAGIMASTVKAPIHLRFCSQCFYEDEEKFGEPYWHRLHQVPGILICSKHTCLLEDSKVAVLGENRHEFYPASRETCVSALRLQGYSSRTFNKLVSLAQDIEWLISAGLPSCSALQYQHQYTALLIDKGLATATGRVRQPELINCFSSHFGNELLSLLNSAVDREREHNWLSSIVRKHRKAFHPIRHLLLMKFLCGSAQAFFDDNYEYKPFGYGPWICFNGAAGHYSMPVITKLKISWSADMKKAVGKFSCACGFTYISSDPNQRTENKIFPGKIKAFGNVWEKRLRELVEEQRLGLRATARQLKVDPLTVKRYAERLGLKRHWRTSLSSQDRTRPTEIITKSNAVRDGHRGIWLRLQQGETVGSKTQLRQQAPNLYIWLYRNDRAWLDAHSPRRKIVVGTKQPVDWNARDQEILKLAKLAVLSLQRLTPPARVTLSRIGKSIERSSLLERHLNKLPLTNSYLAGVLESVEDFQIRRVGWAISVLRKQTDFIKVWQVVRLAGLGKDYSKDVAESIADEIHRANSQKNIRKKAG